MGLAVDSTSVGVVAIGRNEGERLLRCLQSVQADERTIVYVDSGSSDGSLQLARDFGVEAMELDLSTPFTAARARNVGWRRLVELNPKLRMVQFIDGDCELAAGWMSRAREALNADEGLVVVCGRRRERFPEATTYNQLCDMEWDTPVGEAEECGGDAMMKVHALVAVDGFDDTCIAGEEPELCFRLREKKWTIRRLDCEMTIHDAAMSRLDQWWKRSKRAGHAYAGNYRRHRGQAYRIGQVRSALFWGLILPLNILVFGVFLNSAIFLGLLVFPAQVVRISLHLRGGTDTWTRKMRFIYALNCVASKFPHVAGILDEVKSHRAGRVDLIEYK